MKLTSRLPLILATITTTAIGLLHPVAVKAAGIKNPVIGNLGNNPTKAADGTLFTAYFVNLWRVIMSIGAIMVLVYFIWGAIEWITSGGDKGKTEAARNRITNAVIGLIILVSSFTIIGFIGKLFFGTDFDILKLTFPTPTP
jgi:hypothetical protein